MEKWVLHVDGEAKWITASDTMIEGKRRALIYFNAPFDLSDSDAVVHEKYRDLLYAMTKNHDQIGISLVRPQRGNGKTEPEKKLIGYRMGSHDKVYPLHIFHPVYEEEPSTYVTRESAIAALAEFYNRGLPMAEAVAMLEAKPKERVKAGRKS